MFQSRGAGTRSRAPVVATLAVSSARLIPRTTNALPHDPGALGIAGAVEAESEETAIQKRETADAQRRRAREPRVDGKVGTVGIRGGGRRMRGFQLGIQPVRTTASPRRMAKMRQENGIAGNQLSRPPTVPDPPDVRVGRRSRVRVRLREKARLRPRPGIREQNAPDLLRAAVEAGQELHAGDPQATAAEQRQGQRKACEAHASEPGGESGILDIELLDSRERSNGVGKVNGKVDRGFELGALGDGTVVNDGSEAKLAEFGHGPVNASELVLAVRTRSQSVEVTESDIDQRLGVIKLRPWEDLTVPDDDPATRRRRAPLRRSLEAERGFDGDGIHGADSPNTRDPSRSYSGTGRIYFENSQPPPMSATAEALWCGARNGRVARSPAAGSSSPATE